MTVHKLATILAACLAMANVDARADELRCDDEAMIVQRMAERRDQGLTWTQINADVQELAKAYLPYIRQEFYASLGETIQRTMGSAATPGQLADRQYLSCHDQVLRNERAATAAGGSQATPAPR